MPSDAMVTLMKKMILMMVTTRMMVPVAIGSSTFFTEGIAMGLERWYSS